MLKVETHHKGFDFKYNENYVASMTILNEDEIISLQSFEKCTLEILIAIMDWIKSNKSINQSYSIVLRSI